MSNAYLVFAGWGCFEVENGSTVEWFSDHDAAKERHREISKEYRQSAMSEAALIDRSPNLIWTSDEYFFAALLCFPQVALAKGQPDELSSARLRSNLEKSHYDLKDYAVEITGQTWGENGEGAFEIADVINRITESS